MKNIVIKMYKKAGTGLYDVQFTAMDYSDPNMKLIQGVTVNSGGKNGVTNLGGVCVISGLNAGSYTFEATHPDYNLAIGSFTLP